MRVVKFPWLKHTEGPRQFEIYSVSVSPDGSRLATGGLDGKVKIWSIDTLNKYKNKSKNDIGIKHDKNECRPLCSMSRHEGAITCVRFSSDGRFLASGSDDKLILIWEKDEEKTRIMAMHRNGIANSIDEGSPFMDGVGEDVDLEHWTVRKRLVAHDNDVQDMAWAPDGSILVTVGLDRSIVVWNGLTFEKIKRFDIHQSHVKGVVFDPAGKYFATCSDDRTMRVFRYRRSINIDGAGNDMEFVIEKVIRDPFAKSPLTTYFRRCSWSPDGLYIAAPNGTNEGVNANVVIKRGTWESELSLIGHRLPCEVCSFSPRLYTVDQNKKSETVIITAGQDRTLAVWSSSCPTPLCVTTEISAKSITDVAWNANGLNVFICGLDGVVLSIFFDESELGKVIPLEDNNNILVRYGKDRDLIFPESVEQLRLEEYAEKTGIMAHQLLQNQREPDRIRSLMNGTDNLNNSSALNGPPKAAVMNVLIPRSKKHPNRRMPVPGVESKEIIVSSSPVEASILTPKTQKVTITKSGKKRVAPMLISGGSTSATESQHTRTLTFPSTSSKTSHLKELNLKRRAKLSRIISMPYPPLPKHGLSTLVSSYRSKVINDDGEMDNMDNNIDYIADNHDPSSETVTNSKKRPASNGRSSSYNNKRGINDQNRESNINGVRKVLYPGWSKNLAVTSLNVYGEKNANSNILIGNKLFSDGKEEQMMEVRFEFENGYKYLDRNDAMANDRTWREFDAISMMRGTYNDKAKNDWELFLNEKITCLEESECGGLSYWCICTENGRVILVSTTGRQLCGSIELGSNVVKLICNKKFVMCVCANSLVYSWEFTNVNGIFLRAKSIIDAASLAPLVNMHLNQIIDVGDSKKKVNVENIVLDSLYMRDNGTPLVCVRNQMKNEDNINDRKSFKHYVYSFDTRLESWIEILDDWYLKIINDDDAKSRQLEIISGNDKVIRAITGKVMRFAGKERIKVGDNISKTVLQSWNSLNKCAINCIYRN
jgi:protein HIRA/HIR1